MNYRPNPRVQANITQIFINNEWRNSKSGKTFPVINPATGEKIVDVQEGDRADVEVAIQAAKAAFKIGSKWRTMDAYCRGRLVYRLADLMERDTEYIANLQTLENGKPFRDSLNDLAYAIRIIRYYAGCADKIHGKVIPSDGSSFTYTRLEPVGICGIIGPWNFPILLSITRVGAALTCGNSMILKPAEQTPLTSLYLAALTKEAGFPPGVLNVVPGYGPTAGNALASSMEVDKIFFTGSTEVGKLVQQAAGRSNVKRVSLALSGKNPLVICPDADLDEAAEIAVAGCFVNQGQCCCSGSRIFVHESIYDAFVPKCRALAQKRVVGDPFDERTVQGAQIDGDRLKKIMELIESGKREGAKLECGGSRQGTKGFFIQPTVFSNVEDNMRIAREEIFGPVMQILKYRTLEEVIERANSTEYGLAAGIITKNLNTASIFTQQVRAGIVWVNCYFRVSGSGCAQVPSGGVKMSGNGREFGFDGLDDYCELKSVTTMIPQKNS